MPDIRIFYKGAEIAAINENKTFVLKTKSAFCDDDITIEYNRPVTEFFDYFIQYKHSIKAIHNLNALRTGSYTFTSCSSLKTVYFSECQVIDPFTFNSCSSLRAAIFPKCYYILSGAFTRCTSLKTLSFPECQEIYSSAFYLCSNALTSIDFPKCTSIYSAAFNSCYKLATASFSALKYIGSSAFNRCYNLTSLYLLGSTIVSLPNSNAFTSTPIAGYTTSTGGVYGSIYVPSSLFASYKNATNWTYFSSRFVSVSMMPF